MFYRSEAPQQAEARSTKIVFVRRNFSFELSPATYSVRFHNESREFVYDNSDLGNVMYRINYAENTVTMTGKIRYNAPPLDCFVQSANSKLSNVK